MPSAIKQVTETTPAEWLDWELEVYEINPVGVRSSETDPTQIELYRATQWAKAAHVAGWGATGSPYTYRTKEGAVIRWSTESASWVVVQTATRKGVKSKGVPEDLLLTASNLEIMVYAYLIGKGEVFEFQAQLIGGFGNETGDAKVDFVLPEKMLAYRVQGEYWHTGTDVEAKDQLQKERLSAMGYTVVDLWQRDFELPGHFNDMMERALQGEEMPQ